MKKNLFQNGDFKDAMRDWSLQTVSTLDSNNWVTGTLSAGAAGFTQTSSTTAEALEGRNSGKWAKGAANYQRQGFQSEVLQVDKELQGNVVKFDFSYNLTQVSGTLSLTGVVTTHDIKIAIYDLTNSAWLQPSGHMAINSIGIAAIATGEFQLPINTAQVKMFIYQATTSTAAWSIVADSFRLGKVERVYGSVVTDWQAWTPTGTWTTNTVYTGKWRRVGDSMQIYAQIYLNGAPNSSYLAFNLPTGYTIDTSKINSSSQVLGAAQIVDSATRVYTGSSYYYNATSIGLSHSESTNFGTVSDTSPFTFGLNDNLTIFSQVPIVGWSSSTLVSSDSETRVVAASAQGTGTNAMTTGTTYYLAMTTSNFDTHGVQTVSAATNGTTTKSGWYYTCPSLGYYQVTSQISTNGSNIAANTYVAASLRKNGSNHAAMGIVAGGSNPQYSSINGTQTVFCKAGDYLELAFETSSSTITLANNQGSSVSVIKVQGPNTIASSNTVSARYTTAAGQAITSGSAQIVNFGTKDWDYRSSVTTGGSWKFVAPEPGLYLVKACVYFSYNATSIVTADSSLYLAKNGLGISLIGSRVHDVSNNSLSGVHGSDEVRLLAGEYIDVRAYQNNGITVNLQADAVKNFISITKIGSY